MRCTRCHTEVSCADARDYGGQVLCEDCYVEALSPVRTCDPWAVHLARSLKDSQGAHTLTPRQQRLYDLVKDRGEVSFPEAARTLDLPEEEVRREFATLRHMELLRAAKGENLILITLF
jgi:hypothetical protein